MPAVIDHLPTPETADFHGLLDDMAIVSRQRRRILDIVTQHLHWALDAQQRLNDMWQLHLKLEPAELHAHRAEWFASIDRKLDFARQLMQILPQVEAFAGVAIEDAHRLPAVIRGLEDYREIFEERWHDLDDAEGMIASEKIALTEEELRGLAAKYPPPQSWYEETEKPF